MEEKSSRVVEVLLAAVRPVQLLERQGARDRAGGLRPGRPHRGRSRSCSPRPSAPTSCTARRPWWWSAPWSGWCSATPSTAGSTPPPAPWPSARTRCRAWPSRSASPSSSATSSPSPRPAPATPSAFFKVLAYLPPTAPFAMPVLVGLSGRSPGGSSPPRPPQRRVHRGGGPARHLRLPAGHPAHRPAGPAPRGVRPGRLTRGDAQTAAPAQSDPACTVSVSRPERSTRPGHGPGELAVADDLGPVHQHVPDARPPRRRGGWPRRAGRRGCARRRGRCVAGSNTTTSAKAPGTSRPRSRRP